MTNKELKYHNHIKTVNIKSKRNLMMNFSKNLHFYPVSTDDFVSTDNFCKINKISLNLF